MIRKHWLINALGQRYDFTDRNSIISPDTFLYNPSGFGFTRQYTSLVVGNSELVTSQQFRLTDIRGELLFFAGTTGGMYEDYQKFIQFAKYKPLEFHYQTPNELTSYFCDVIFTTAEKGEVSTDHVLHVPVIFHRLTEWLDSTSYTVTLYNETIGDGKYYPLERPYHYAGTNLSGTPINNVGTDDVGFILTIDGEVQNPQFTLTQYGESYGICKINGTYDFLQIDSVERTEKIYAERNGSVITNPEQYQDFTIANGQAYLTWCKFRVGETIFSFTSGNISEFDGTITIQFKNSYATV